MSFIVNSSLCNVSLVGFYQNKPSNLTELIKEIQTYLSQTSILKNKFQKYSLEQIHGTIVGCEGIVTKRGIINRWFLENRGETKYMNLEGWSQYLQKSERFPLTLRFGGYHPDLDYQFLSRNQHPFERSFQLQILKYNRTKSVLIGWSYQNQSISLTLDKLRRDARKFNCLHKYHDSPTTVDNDFYLCLGVIKAQLRSTEITSIQNKIRKILQTKLPLYLSFTKKDLAFVRYQHPSLPSATTKTVSIWDLNSAKLKEWTQT